MKRCANCGRSLDMCGNEYVKAYGKYYCNIYCFEEEIKRKVISELTKEFNIKEGHYKTKVTKLEKKIKKLYEIIKAQHKRIEELNRNA